MKKYNILRCNTLKFRSFVVVTAFFEIGGGRFEKIQYLVISNCKNSQKRHVIGKGGRAWSGGDTQPQGFSFIRPGGTQPHP